MGKDRVYPTTDRGKDLRRFLDTSLDTGVASSVKRLPYSGEPKCDNDRMLDKAALEVRGGWSAGFCLFLSLSLCLSPLSVCLCLCCPPVHVSLPFSVSLCPVSLPLSLSLPFSLPLSVSLCLSVSVSLCPPPSLPFCLLLSVSLCLCVFYSLCLSRWMWLRVE